MPDSAKFAPALSCFKTSSALAFAAASVFRVSALRHGDKNVSRLHLLRRLVLIFMRRIITLYVSVSDCRLATGQVRAVEREELNLSLLRNRSGVTRRVLLEERLQVCVARIDVLADVRCRNHRVIKFNLGAPLPCTPDEQQRSETETPPSPGHKRLQPLLLHLRLDCVLEISQRHVEVLRDEVPCTSRRRCNYRQEKGRTRILRA